MAEYIEREALVHRLKSPYLFNITQRIFDIISEIPAADVVQVLRCKDCKEWGPGTGDVPICWETYEPMPPDGFCSIGERKPSAGG